MASLAQEAWDNRLGICAGAGISVPAGLPTGLQLANRLFDHLTAKGISLQPGLRDDLVSLANHIDGLPGGRRMLRGLAVRLFAFEEAPSAFAHQVLALLAIDGAATVMLTNWDDCVERGVPEGARIRAIITPADAALVGGARVLKIHGCATRSDSLLISTADLANPPLWVQAGVAGALSMGTLIFVGIGDVADHTKTRVTELVEGLGTQDVSVYLVGPSVADEWADSAWSTLVPELPDDNKIGTTADEFLDELMRALLLTLLAKVETAATELQSTDLVAGVTRLLDALREVPALQLARWLHDSGHGWPAGSKLIRSVAMTRCLLALAWQVAAHDDVVVQQGMKLRIGGELVEILLAESPVSGGQLRRAGEERMHRARSAGTCQPDETIVYVCLGHVGTLMPASVPVVDIVDGDGDPQDVIGGHLAGVPVFVSAEDMLEKVV